MEIYFALVPALIHVLFFALESLLWGKRSTNKIFRLNETEAETVRPFAFNQGFYNLFLSIAVFVGAGLKGQAGKNATQAAYGDALIGYSLASMFLAGVVLYLSASHLWRGAVIQAGPAAVALIPYLINLISD